MAERIDSSMFLLFSLWFVLVELLNYKCNGDSTHNYLIASSSDQNNLYLIDLEAEQVAAFVLLSGQNVTDGYNQNLRGIGVYNRQIYAANIDGNKSFIGMWKCDSTINIQENNGAYFNGYFTQYNEKTNNGLNYPYSLLFYTSKNVKNGLLYASAHNTNSLLIYDKNGNPDTKAKGMNGNYPGAILTYPGSDGIYDIAIDETNELLFIANSVEHVVLVYDIKNNFKHLYNITNGESSFEPRGLAYNSTYFPGVLFVSDYSGYQVYSFNVTKETYSLFWVTEKYGYLENPTGLAISNNNILYVTSKKGNEIIKLNPSTGEYIDYLFDFDYAFEGENLLFVEAGSCIS